jgi:penicillin-binding protein 1C
VSESPTGSGRANGAPQEPQPLASPHSPSKTGVNALMVGEVGARSAPGGGLSESAACGGTPSLALPHKGGGDRPPARKQLRIAAAATGIAAAALAITFAAWVHSLGPVPLGESLEFSTVVVDRNGRLLRPYATSDGRWRLPATVKDVDPRYLDLLIDYEDKRFRKHRGVDPIAVGRAALQLVSNGRIVSGASTLTMQVARLLEPRTDRTFLAKLRQAVRAIQLEQRLSKDEILTLDLGLAP